MSAKFYTVEKILDMSYVDDEKWFKVKWEGYGMLVQSLLFNSLIIIN